MLVKLYALRNWVVSVLDSAVNVLPTPGGPVSKSINPWPLQLLFSYQVIVNGIWHLTFSSNYVIKLAHARSVISDHG